MFYEVVCKLVIIFMMKLFQNLRNLAKNFYVHKDKTEEKMPTWQDLLDHKYSLKFIINEICRNIKVLNGKSDDILDYDNFVNENDFGLHTIDNWRR